MICERFEEESMALKYPGRASFSDKQGWLDAVKEYNEKQWDITRRFHLALSKEYTPNAPAHKEEKLWRHAWEEGHSGGYHEVENYYMELANLIQP